MTINRPTKILSFYGNKKELRKFFQMMCTGIEVDSNDRITDLMEEDLKQNEYFWRLYKESQKKYEK